MILRWLDWKEEDPADAETFRENDTELGQRLVDNYNACEELI